MTRDMTRRTRIALTITALVWLAWLFMPTRLQASLDQAVARAGRELRYWGGRRRALRHRRLDPNVPDAELADQVRAALLALERRLDIRRIHVTAEDHVVILHGEVPAQRSARWVEQATLRVPGVIGLESYLHVGPIEEGARPSAGMRYPDASEAKKRLLHAAYDAGAPVEINQRVVRAVLAFLADRIPEGELEQFTAHLPRDVRAMCYRPTRNGTHRRPARTVTELTASLAPATDPLPPERAQHVIQAVLGTLRDLVPEEDQDIAAVLPDELRDLWLASTPR